MKNHYHKPDSLVAQGEGTAVNGLYLNSISDGSGSNNKTSEMSGSTSASAEAHGPSNGYFTGKSGRLSLSSQMGYTIGRDGSWQQTTYRDFSINLSHTHDIYALSTDAETRPSNYTVKVWKRIS